MRLSSGMGCWVLVGSLLALAGCSSDPNTGYTTASLYWTQYKSIHIPMWTRGSAVYRREDEMRLTEAVQKRVEAYTPYKIKDKSKADTELTGGIDEIQQRTLSVNPDTGLAREIEVTFILHFRWVDIATGKVLVERRNFKVSGTYFPESPLDEDFYLGSADVIDRAATRIVEQMQKPFTK